MAEFERFAEDKSSLSSSTAAPRKPKSRQKLFYGVLIVALIGCIIGLAVGIPLSKRDTGDPDAQEVVNVLSEYPLIDGHNDMPWQFRQYVQNKVYDVNLREDTRLQWPNTTNMTSYDFPRIPPQTDIPRLKQGMVGAQFWVSFAPCSSSGKDAVRIGLAQVDVIHKIIEQYDDTFEFVTTAQGILDAYQKRKKIASLIGLEGGHMISNTLGVLRLFYTLGVRYMTLTHSCDTSWADNWKQDTNATGSRRGLSDFGKIVVKEMNRIGMIIDLAHVAKQTMIDAITTSVAPVIFSHSNPYAKCNHYRNVQDDVLQLVKAHKGLLMINFYDRYVSKGCLPLNTTESTIDHVVEHIEYVKDTIGIDYVGIGADYDGVPTLPVGLEDVSTFPALFTALRKKGWSNDNLKKLAGENLIRVFRKVEEVKKQQQNLQPYEDIVPQDEVVPDHTCYTSF